MTSPGERPAVPMNLVELADLVARWASTQPIVSRAHLYGSRVHGTNGPNSDLDVAIEIIPLPGDISPLATWIAEGRGLAESLASLLPCALDLEWYGGATETPTIHRGLVAGSVLVYEQTVARSRSD